MHIEEFIQKFESQFDLSEGEVVAASTRFKNLADWGSLTLMLVIGFVQTDCGKNLSAEEISKCETVEDLYNIATE